MPPGEPRGRSQALLSGFMKSPFTSTPPTGSFRNSKRIHITVRLLQAPRARGPILQDRDGRNGETSRAIFPTGEGLERSDYPG
jgi:hypothetical protein